MQLHKVLFYYLIFKIFIMSLNLIPPSKRVFSDDMYCEKSKCPICHQKVKKSDYLHQIFADEPIVEWLANLITHYRHDHLTSWNKCWGYNGGFYGRGWFKDYETEKKKVNERAKRQIIRKGLAILIKNGVKPSHFKRLENTSIETLKIAEAKLI